MIYRFRDIQNTDMYNTARVLYVTGQYAVFNNMVIDKIRGMCRGDIEYDLVDTELDDEFNISNSEANVKESYINFTEFLEVVKIPPLSGKWFCSVDYKMITKRQRDRLARYTKKPSENGVLCVYMQDYSDYRNFLRDSVLRAHMGSHLIQLQFPNRNNLKEIVQEMFSKRGVRVPEKAVELFIMRMGNSYEEYEGVLDTVCSGKENSFMSYKEFSEAMKGIENYVLDDLIEQLLTPIKSRKIVTSRKIYRMVDSVVEDIGARAIVNKLRYKLDELIEMRIIINDGVVPVKLRYSVREAKDRIGEGHKMYKMNDYTFKRLAELASKTSLKDLVFMRMMLNNINRNWDESEHRKVLMSIVHRAVFSPSRIINDLGVCNVIEEQLYDVNAAFINTVENKL